MEIASINPPVKSASTEKRKVVNTLVSIGTFDKVVDKIFDLPILKASSYVCFANVHMIVEAYKNNQFSKVLENADIVAPDGLPISKYISFFDKINQDRIAGPDVMPVILERSEKTGKSVFFYGSTEEILDQLTINVKKKHPELRIAGSYSPPFRELSKDESNEIIDLINSSKPDFIFVALGCPKQEKWMFDHLGKINGCMLGVGQAFEICAEVRHRAPHWMQNFALEWAYRLFLEPRRLWRRYLYTNLVFMGLILMYFKRIKRDNSSKATA